MSSILNLIKKVSFFISLTLFICLSFIKTPINTQATTFSNFTFGFSNDQYYGGPNDPMSYRSPTFGGPTNAKIVAGPWLQSGWDYYGDEHTAFLNNFKVAGNTDKIPYLTVYVAAGMGKQNAGLKDCNTTSSTDPLSLCVSGAKYIRNNSNSIANKYTEIANKIKTIQGTTKPIFLHIEPDFYQYNSDPKQQNPLSRQEAWNYLNAWTDSIKQVLPNASLVLDISPWNPDIAGWSAGFRNFSYSGLVGKDFPPSGVDGKTYAQMKTATGKPIIINSAHGVGGALLGHRYAWDSRTVIQNAASEGVVALLQPGGYAGNKNHYTNIINGFLSSPVALPTSNPNPTPNCNFSDLQSSNVDYTGICNLFNSGIVSGFPDGTFRPSATVSRGEMSKFVKNSFFGPNFTDLSCGGFPDVPTNSVFYREITTLKCRGVISGYPDGTFRSNEKVTRGAATKFVIMGARRSKNNPNYYPKTNSGSSFPDVATTSVFYRDIQAAFDNNLLVTPAGSNFRPNDPITRGNMATLVDKAR
jgi:hypothetical protein